MKKRIDNKTKYNMLIIKMYEGLFKLDTDTLSKLHCELYRELISRDDYCSLDDLKMTYEIFKEELIERGVSHV